MADINVTAHGINPETGEYLSPAERKALFKKGRMGSKIDPSAFRSGVASTTKKTSTQLPRTETGGGGNDGGDGGGVGAIVPFAEVSSSALSTDVEPPIEKVRVNVDDAPPEQSEESKETFKDALKKLLETLKRVTKLKNIQGKTSKKTDKLKEKGKKKKKKERKTPGRDIFGLGRKISGKATKVFGDIFGIFGDILAFAALNWISDPKNRGAVKAIIGFLGHAFKFIDYVVTGFVDNTLTGLSQLLGPDRTIGERFSGALKLLGSFFILRWLKNPFKIIKDVKRIFKLTKGFAKFVNKIFRKPIKMIQNFVQKALNKTLGKLFMSNLFKPLRRFIIKVGGKSLFKLLGAVGRGFTKMISRIPFIGALLQFFLDVFVFKQPPARSAFKAIGTALIGAIGAAVGGPFGAFIGGWAGGNLGGLLYDGWFGGGSSSSSNEQSTTGGANATTTSDGTQTGGGTGTNVADSAINQQAALLLRNYEGLRLNAYPDPYTNAEPYTIGIGATYYPPGFRLGGGRPGRKVEMGDRITEAEAFEIKRYHVKQFADGAESKIGSETWNKLPAGVKVALISKAFNYGEVYDSAIPLIKSGANSGDFSELAGYFRNRLAKHNKGINSWRRNDEASVILTNSSPRAKLSFGGGTGIPLRKDYPMGRAGAKQFKLARKAHKNSTFASDSASFTINEKLKNNQTSATFIVNNFEEKNVGMSISGLTLNKGRKSGNQILSRL